MLGSEELLSFQRRKGKSKKARPPPPKLPSADLGDACPVVGDQRGAEAQQQREPQHLLPSTRPSVRPRCQPALRASRWCCSKQGEPGSREGASAAPSDSLLCDGHVACAPPPAAIFGTGIPLPFTPPAPGSTVPWKRSCVSPTLLLPASHVHHQQRSFSAESPQMFIAMKNRQDTGSDRDVCFARHGWEAEGSGPSAGWGPASEGGTASTASPPRGSGHCGRGAPTRGRRQRRQGKWQWPGAWRRALSFSGRGLRLHHQVAGRRKRPSARSLAADGSGRRQLVRLDRAGLPAGGHYRDLR